MPKLSKFEPRTFCRPPDGDGEGTERKEDSSSDEYESDDGEDVALRILNNIDRDDGFISRVYLIGFGSEVIKFEHICNLILDKFVKMGFNNDYYNSPNLTSEPSSGC